jgi:hypothetical protein
LIWGAAVIGASGILATHAAAAQSTDKPKVYTCPPCGCPNDGKDFAAPGACSVCAMPLVEKPPAPLAKPDAAGPGEPPAEPKAKSAPPERPSPK